MLSLASYFHEKERGERLKVTGVLLLFCKINTYIKTAEETEGDDENMDSTK